MEAKISLERMRFYSAIGCYATERKVGSRFEVDIEYTYDAQRVMLSDDIRESINYVEVYDELSAIMSLEIATIEHLGATIIGSLFEKFNQMTSLRVTLRKIAPPIGGDIAASGVTLSVQRG